MVVAEGQVATRPRLLEAREAPSRAPADVPESDSGLVHPQRDRPVGAPRPASHLAAVEADDRLHPEAEMDGEPRPGAAATRPEPTRVDHLDLEPAGLERRDHTARAGAEAERQVGRELGADAIDRGAVISLLRVVETVNALQR